MDVASTRFGSIHVQESSIVDLGPGLLGFGDSPRFALVEVDETYVWLQSLERSDLAFLAMQPWGFFPEYELDVPDDVLEEIGLSEPGDAMVLVLLTAIDKEGHDPSLTANLLGPVVVNKQTNQGRQLVLAGGDYSTREPLAYA